MDWMNASITWPVLTVSLYIILFRQEDEAARQWAVGAIAFVMGYYLRGSEPHVHQ
jgi:hypothetical protein